jgi:hypothetical protein
MDDLQTKLLDRALKKFPKQSVAVAELSRLLNVGQNGVYRRLRGETALLPAEIDLLANAFDLSIDNLIFEQKGKILFSYSLFSRPVYTLRDYLDSVREQAEYYAAQDETYVYYTTQEIPIFLYYSSPLLFRFKMYIYSSIYWNLEFVKDKPFSFDLIPEKFCGEALDIARLYNSLPSEELWSINVLDKTLSQMEFLLQSGKFAYSEEVLMLCNAIEELVDHVKSMAANGRKALPQEPTPEGETSYRLYYNELTSTNDTLLVTVKSGKILFTSVGMPNFLYTTNEFLCNNIYLWFQEMAQRSNSLTVHAAKNRDWFFNRLKEKINYTRKRLDLLMED